MRRKESNRIQCQSHKFTCRSELCKVSSKGQHLSKTQSSEVNCVMHHAHEVVSHSWVKDRSKCKDHNDSKNELKIAKCKVHMASKESICNPW